MFFIQFLELQTPVKREMASLVVIDGYHCERPVHERENLPTQYTYVD